MSMKKWSTLIKRRWPPLVPVATGSGVANSEAQCSLHPSRKTTRGTREQSADHTAEVQIKHAPDHMCSVGVTERASNLIATWAIPIMTARDLDRIAAKTGPISCRSSCHQQYIISPCAALERTPPITCPLIALSVCPVVSVGEAHKTPVESGSIRRQLRTMRLEPRPSVFSSPPLPAPGSTPHA
jgi:hypothetical protein